ncbi:MAG: phosphohydrolase [Lachnospiraceae bacterium]|nr:phosphohydrolase [Lachnospiraceae bacterium]
MLFVRLEKLKEGMRLAKPIYNKKGVLLYDRNSKLTSQGIESVRNFGIIGLYILEPAEPLPPMSEEDIEFEKFFIVSTFVIQDEMKIIRDGNKPQALENLVTQIIKRYGRLDHKVNFVQSLRTREDTHAKHALNSAILCAMLSHQMNIKLSEQHDTVVAALLHNIGLLDLPDELQMSSGANDEESRNTIQRALMSGVHLIENATSDMPSVKRIAGQAIREIGDFRNGRASDTSGKQYDGGKILKVASVFDDMTAMNDYDEPSSEISALRFLMKNYEAFDPDVVDALTKSINILVPGCSVELSSGEKALVINENTSDILKPIVLSFSTNTIIDLGQELIYGNLYIKDVMKTMDNRCVIDPDALKNFGKMS